MDRDTEAAKVWVALFSRRGGVLAGKADAASLNCGRGSLQYLGGAVGVATFLLLGLLICTNFPLLTTVSLSGTVGGGDVRQLGTGWL